ncbi:long-chain fatty acid--CoA ligase [Nocardia spumae]|uniref:long-chain fatty acid--CoA ligase n=1 Tax=Nocardia spumae TaxID=2887190 RepID=UPI001D13BE8E|nr:long-chain fatty acid--CoA ligase [Nocardia spumae]
MPSTMQDEPLLLATLVRYACRAHPNATVRTWTGTESRVLTYAQVGAAAAQLAHALASLGVQPGDRVGTFMWNNNEHLIAYAGVPAMGAVLHTLNIRLFPEQVSYVANHAADRVVIVDGSLVRTFAAILPELMTVRHVIVAGGDPADLEAPRGVEVHSFDALLAGRPTKYPYPEIDETSAAAMCYTSGTTGLPKGVVYSHRSNWLHSMYACTRDGMGISRADTILAIVPMFHANAWGLPYAALMSGASLIMPDRFLQPAALLEMMDIERPSFAAAVPTVWNGVLAALEDRPQDITHLRCVIVGGAAVPPQMIRAFAVEHGVEIVQAWGMTETSPLGTVARPPDGLSDEEEFPYRVSQGFFPPAVQGRLVAEDGSIQPWDGKSMGELHIRGPWITGAYYAPDGGGVDADKFSDGWLCTGDIGTITPDGYLTLVDRAKDIIKSGGEWISSVDLENAVMAHPDVVEAAVFGVPDEKWDERPVVAVVLRPGSTAEAAVLRDSLTDKFAKWQLPQLWAFVTHVPKTSVGKFDKKRLRAEYGAGEMQVVSTAAVHT